MNGEQLDILLDYFHDFTKGELISTIIMNIPQEDLIALADDLIAERKEMAGETV